MVWPNERCFNDTCALAMNTTLEPATGDQLGGPRHTGGSTTIQVRYFERFERERTVLALLVEGPASLIVRIAFAGEDEPELLQAFAVSAGPARGILGIHAFHGMPDNAIEHVFV